MYRLFNVAEPTPESMRVAPVAKGLPVTASGAASDVLAADVQIFLRVEALLMR